MDSVMDLKRDGFARSILRFGIPVAMQNLLTSSLALVDSIMIGKLGSVALGAVGTAAQWFTMLNTVCWGVQSAAIVFFSQYWGAKDKPGIIRTAWLLFACVFGFMTIAEIATVIRPNWVMQLYTNDVETISAGAKYLRIAAVSYGFSVISTGISGLMRSVGKASFPFLASALSLGSNTFLNWVLIYGKLGFP